jgi:hypothetical protein
MERLAEALSKVARYLEAFDANSDFKLSDQ